MTNRKSQNRPSHLSAIQKNARKIAMDSFVEGRMVDGKRILEVEGVNLTKSQAETVARQLTDQGRTDDATTVLMLVAKKEPEPEIEASASFAIHTDHEDVVTDNAREHFGPEYGDEDERATMMKQGLVNADGDITDTGWERLRKDVQALEENAFAWLRKTFITVRDDGHDWHGDLIGTVWFNPRNKTHAYNIVTGKKEQIDFHNMSKGMWKGVSKFGQYVLGGAINFDHIEPAEAYDIAEETD